MWSLFPYNLVWLNTFFFLLTMIMTWPLPLTLMANKNGFISQRYPIKTAVCLSTYIYLRHVKIVSTYVIISKTKIIGKGKGNELTEILNVLEKDFYQLQLDMIFTFSHSFSSHTLLTKLMALKYRINALTLLIIWKTCYIFVYLSSMNIYNLW